MKERRERQTVDTFGIDRQGYDTEDVDKKTERADVSPFGTEGIFIDVDIPERIEEKK